MSQSQSLAQFQFTITHLTISARMKFPCKLFLRWFEPSNEHYAETDPFAATPQS